MLLDLHANPGNLSPEAFAEAVRDAGLGGVVIARTHVAGDLTPWFEALEDLDLAAFAGVELRLAKGSVVFIPTDWEGAFATADWAPPEGDCWTNAAITARLAEIDGALIASHPYCRDMGDVLADRIYALKGLAGVQIRAGRGRLTWDNLAEGFAQSRKVACLGTSGGDLAWLGRAATVMPDEIDDEQGLVAALKAGKVWPVEFDVAGERRDRTPPPAPERRERRDDDDRGGRGGRDGGRGGREGGRGGREGGGRGGREGGGRGGRGGREGGGRGGREGGGRGGREGGGRGRGPRKDG